MIFTQGLEPPAATINKEVQLTAEELHNKIGSYRNAVDGHVARISVKGDKSS